jgi:putative ABC transport system permease protein
MPGFSSFVQDLRYAARVLRQAPGFTLIAVAVLAIGIGANSAIFSLVDAVVLRALPFPHPDELAMLWEHSPGYVHNRVSPLNFSDWHDQNQVFTAMAAVSGGSRVLTGAGSAPERITGQAVTRSFFDLLGVTPLAGRVFTADDFTQSASVVIFSERIWRARFGADPTLIGRSVTLDSQPVTVVGILPASFQLLYAADMWTPFLIRHSPDQRKPHYLQVIARRKPGVTLEQARAGMNLVADQIAQASPETNKGWTVTVEPLRDALVPGDLRTTSVVLAGVVGFVLLMACANVANLLLARGAGRSREMAVRASLGGSRGRIVRQLLTESLLLAAMGGAAGLTLAWLLVRFAPAFLPAGTLPAGFTLTLDARVAAFAAAATLLTGIVFGLAPVFQAARTSLGDALRSGGRSATGHGSAFRTVLAAGEIAVAVMLVAGAGLLARTLLSMQQVDPGYRAENVLTAAVNLPFNRYAPTRAATFYRNVEHELAALPGVRAAIGGSLPLDGQDIGQSFEVVGDPPIDSSSRPAANYQMIGSGYFDALGIPLLRGRAFDERDSASAPPVCIVNEEFVRRYLHGKDPLAARITVDSMDLRGPTPVTRDVVGVIRQVKVQGPDERENTVDIYVPVAQNAWFWAKIVARAGAGSLSTDPAALLAAVKAAVAKFDQDLPLTRVRSMEQVASDAIAQPRFRAELVGAFAALALALAAAGVFGVLAFAVSQRTREFGIRMALGAQRGDVLAMVVRGGLRITLLGVALGLAGAAAVTRSLATLLFNVQPLDPVTFAAAPILLSLVALAACALPALRASRVDPAVALRQE